MTDDLKPSITSRDTEADDMEPVHGVVVKGDVIEVEIPDARSSATPDEQDAFVVDGLLGADVVPFPLPSGFTDPAVFIDIWKKSAALQPPIEAYASDIDGMGHTFEPAFDPNLPDAIEELREAHIIHRTWLEMYAGKEEKDLPEEPTDEELAVEVEALKKEARQQKMRAEYFFRSASREQSFTRMRKNTRQESETGGNWYWETIRKNNVPIRLKHPPFQSFRAIKEDKEPTKVASKIQVSPVHWEDFEENITFRRYVQKTEAGGETYFKQFGDPRFMCANTGTYYPDAKDLKQAESQAKRSGNAEFLAATEVLHDGAVHVPGSPYFLPRWIGAVDFVLGEGAAAEFNLSFFNRPFPAGFLLCAGGVFAKDLKAKLKEYMTQMMGKSGGFHRIMAIEAVGGGGVIARGNDSATVKLEWVPLMKDRPTDAQFLKYMTFCQEVVGRQFRLHMLLFGGSDNLNKATAWAVLKFAEERVYQPLRNEFDDLMNRTLMPALGITLWKFRTLAPEVRDPATMIKIFEVLQKGVALNVDQLVELAGDIVNKDYKPYNKDWSQMPHMLLQYAHDENKTLVGDGTGTAEDGSDSGEEEFGDRDDAPDNGEETE